MMVPVQVLALVALLLSQSTERVTSAYANAVYWYTSTANQSSFIYMQTTLLVPPVPSPSWMTTFAWPGLSPLSGSYNYAPINEGVLQPVLNFGSSCAQNPNNLTVSYNTTWWTSALYANTNTQYANFTDKPYCQGSNQMIVLPGDSLLMVLQLLPGTTIWQQTITNNRNNQTVQFSKDMQGQAQTWATIAQEYWTGSPPLWQGPTGVPKFVFTNIVLKGNIGGPQFCTYHPQIKQLAGASMVCSPTVVNGTTCTIASCTFN